MPVRPSAASFGSRSIGKVLRLVPLHDVGADLGFGELAHRPAQQLLLFGRAGSPSAANVSGEAAGTHGLMAYAEAMPDPEDAAVRSASRSCARSSLRLSHRLDRVRRHHRVSRHQPDARQSPRQGFCRRRRAADRRVRIRVRAHERRLVEAAPSLRTFMFNGLLQTPVPIAGMQFYGTAGGGVLPRDARRRLSETNVGINVGGGVKMSLAGPLRLRFDYRVFTLQGDAAALEAAALLRRDQSEVLSGRRNDTSPAAAVTYPDVTDSGLLATGVRFSLFRPRQKPRAYFVNISLRLGRTHSVHRSGRSFRTSRNAYSAFGTAGSTRTT